MYSKNKLYWLHFLSLTIDWFQLNEAQLELQNNDQPGEEIDRLGQGHRHPSSQFVAHLKFQ